MSENNIENVLQFAPMQSFVSPTFWHKLAEIKLDVDRLSDSPRSIYGYYTNRNAKSCLLEVDYSAYNKDFYPPKFYHKANGILYNKNTVEDFKQSDKNALLISEGLKLVESFKSDEILDDPSKLARFMVLSFADLKCHNYYYWFAFPCPLTPTLSQQGRIRTLQDIPELKHFEDILKIMPKEEQNFFVLSARDDTNYYSLKEVLTNENVLKSDLDDFYFCFADASEYEQPSWLMRLYTAFVHFKCPYLVGKTLKFLGLRYNNQMQPGNSLIWEILLTEPINFDNEGSLKFVGWEPNRNSKMGPRMVSMRESMDPTLLAENSVNLNLKLMKWRLVPDLDLDIISSTKCLLFGAGTLGCAVARSLLAWGFKHITFIDSGKVSFSNPVRQSLYTHADAVTGNAMKARVAAERIKQINPSATSDGYVIEIPMPGHTIGESLLEQTEDNLNIIKNLTEQHDAIFLLTDSRESRWLPTLLGAAKQKIVINAALGFDSYLVMRHGSNRSEAASKGDSASKPTDIGDLKCISGSALGCYFCNDVTAPGNSLKDRTLDQQCTVTRPGVSNIAASYAVELLVSLLQHPQRELAPAYYSNSGTLNRSPTPEGLLGVIPHSIRGMLCNYENILPATQRFAQCIACSAKVLAAYEGEGNAFLLKAFETAKYLEDLTGISEFKNLENEIIDFDDADLEMTDDE